VKDVRMAVNLHQSGVVAMPERRSPIP